MYFETLIHIPHTEIYSRILNHLQLRLLLKKKLLTYCWHSLIIFIHLLLSFFAINETNIFRKFFTKIITISYLLRTQNYIILQHLKPVFLSIYIFIVVCIVEFYLTLATLLVSDNQFIYIIARAQVSGEIKK